MFRTAPTRSQNHRLSRVINDTTPPAEVQIDNALVTALLKSQFPDLAGLPLGSRQEGWDNVTIRLGEELAVRLPRRSYGATLVATEFGWLPRVSAEWTFRLPRLVRMGEPGVGYPWRWSVVTWLEGKIAYDAPLSADGARDLGRALAEVHVVAQANAPRNPFRSTSLASRAERFDLRLQALTVRYGNAVHSDAALTIFQQGAIQEPGPVTWTHLDLHGRNVITLEGRLSGILDWGDAAAGDPASDLGQALTLVGSEHFEELSRAYADAGGAAAPQGHLSASTTARIRAEAVAHAVMLAGIDEDGHSRAGWTALAAMGAAEAGAAAS